MRIRLNNVVISFPSLFRKANYKGTELKYEGTFILDKIEHKQEIDQIQKEIDRILAEDFKTTRAKFKDDKICLKDGDYSENDAFAGKFTIKATNKDKPLTIDYNKNDIVLTQDPFYSGAIVNAVIDLWKMDNEYGKKILANLYGVQFVKDGPKLGNNVNNIQSALNDFDSFDIPFNGDTNEDDDMFA